MSKPRYVLKICLLLSLAGVSVGCNDSVNSSGSNLSNISCLVISPTQGETKPPSVFESTPPDISGTIVNNCHHNFGPIRLTYKFYGFGGDVLGDRDVYDHAGLEAGEKYYFDVYYSENNGLKHWKLVNVEAN